MFRTQPPDTSQHSANGARAMTTTASTAPAATEPTAPASPEPQAEQAHGARPTTTRARISFDDPDYRALVRRVCCTEYEVRGGERVADLNKSATDDEFDAFIATCERLQLDPLARQIHFIKRGSEEYGRKGRAELSIDGLRLVAERTGEYRGQTPREWCDVVVTGGHAALVWYPVWPFGNTKHPLAARVGVLRRGFDEPLYAVARFDAYKQTKSGGALNTMWAKMGPEQLGKCAEALAMRQAFPNELGGTYTTDEMAQADNDADGARPQQQRRAAAQQQPATTSTAATAQPPLHPLAVTAPELLRTVPLFPYGRFRQVALEQKYPAGHEQAGSYVIALDKLQEAETKASTKRNGLPEGDKQRDVLLKLIENLGLEMYRRADEDEATAAQDATEQGAPAEPAPAPATPPDTAAADAAPPAPADGSGAA